MPNTSREKSAGNIGVRHGWDTHHMHWLFQPDQCRHQTHAARRGDVEVQQKDVKKGQSLFQIDPRPFQAALDQAQGQLAQVQGELAQARQPSRWFNFTQLGGTPNPPAAEFFHTSLEVCGLFG